MKRIIGVQISNTEVPLCQGALWKTLKMFDDSKVILLALMPLKKFISYDFLWKSVGSKLILLAWFEDYLKMHLICEQKVTKFLLQKYESIIDMHLKYGIHDVYGVKILRSTSFQKC